MQDPEPEDMHQKHTGSFVQILCQIPILFQRF